MIRKAIIVVLTLGAVLVGILTIALFFRPFPPGPNVYPWAVEAGIVDSDKLHYNWEYGRIRETFWFFRALRPHERHPSYSTVKYPGVWITKSDACQCIVWIWVPLAITAMFAAYPTIAFIRGPLRRWRRRKKGLCLNCGYDLTGNESGVCPECGTEKVRP